jgi:hypothetical protein
MSDSEIEKEIIAKGLTAPRVTPADIEGNIASEHYFTAAHGNEQVLALEGRLHEVTPACMATITLCVLILKNGHKIVGVNEGPVSADNFDAEMGRKFARSKAIDQIWPLMGYALKQQLHEGN